MALDPSLLFNQKWYLDHNPDVAEALENGEITSAYDHFLQYGNAEGRNSSPLFNVEQYLTANPDVAAAVANGDITAHDHFILYGASEGRAPSSLFDESFYLSQNPDVATAVENGDMTAIEHFLQYGQSEPRPFSPSIDLGAYLDANSDIAEAVEAGQMSALDHLMLYGASEGRDLGNGVNLSIFANDSTFQEALAAGDVQGALDRVDEVAPFLPTFVPPTNWEAPANTPIPLDFVPPEGTQLVIPPSVDVPPNTELPDTFVPPEDTDGGNDGDGGEPPIPQTFELTTDDDTFTGRAGDDVFNASSTDGATLQTWDTLIGGAGNDVLNIAAGGLDHEAAPILQSIEIINNAAFSGSDASQVLTLNLSKAQGVQEIWTDASAVKGAGAQHVRMNYTNASLDTVYGIRGWNNDEGEDEIDISIFTTAEETAGDNTTLKVKLEDTEAGDFIHVVARDGGVEHVEVEIIEGSSATLGLGGTATDIQTITLTGAGDITLSPLTGSNGNAIKLLDASEATGAITWKPNNSVESNSTAAAMTVKGGSGNDVFDFSAFTDTELSIDGGAGDDIFTFNKAINNVTKIDGGDGYDELYIEAGAITPYTGVDNRITPTIKNLEYIRNESTESILDFRNITDVQEVETVFGDNDGVDTTYQYYRNTSVDTTFSIDGSNWNEATLSVFLDDAEAGDTAHVKLKDIEGYQVVYFGANDTIWNTEANVSVTMENNSGSLTLNNSFNKIAIAGDGDLRYITFDNQFNEFDASEVDGNITIQKGGDPSQIGLSADAIITTGVGNDSLNFGASTGNLTIDSGAGNDTIVAGLGQNDLTGGAGSDTFKLTAKGTEEANLDVIQDFNIGGEQDTLFFGNTEMNEDSFSFSTPEGDLFSFVIKEGGTYDELLASANDMFGPNETSFVAGSDGIDTYVFYSANNDTADAAVHIIGMSDPSELFL